MRAVHALTARELQVAMLLARGCTDKQIASDLGITRRTASNHVSTILLKLDASSRTEAVIAAIQHGLIEANNVDLQALPK